MPSKPPADHPALDKIVLLLVSGLSDDALKTACVEKLGVQKRGLAKVLKEARRRLTRAADYNRDEQVGTAITRVNDIYSRAIRAGDIKTALTAQREINKIMALYDAASDRLEADDSESDDTATGDEELGGELAAIRKHLIPLKLASKKYPIREHARIAADLIREYRQATK